MLLCAAYIQAKKWMSAEDTDCWKTWHECCESACSLLNPLGVEQTVNFRRVAHYNLLYRQKEIFPNPRPEIGIGKKPLPPLLTSYPEAIDLINKWCVNNLVGLTLDKVHCYIHDKLLPLFTRLWKDTNGDDTTTMTDFLKSMQLQHLSPTTVWRWMHLLGYSYDTRKKVLLCWWTREGRCCELQIRLLQAVFDWVWAKVQAMGSDVNNWSCQLWLWSWLWLFVWGRLGLHRVPRRLYLLNNKYKYRCKTIHFQICHERQGPRNSYGIIKVNPTGNYQSRRVYL